MHIYDFITDLEQQKIKYAAQNIFKPERFEAVLSHYKQKFFQAFENNPTNFVTVNSTDKSNLLSPRLQKDTDVQIWMKGLLSAFQSDKIQLEKLMDDIIDCYYLFLRGRHHTGVLKMYDILERYEMLDDAQEELLGLFFRCSSVRAGVDFSKECSYYHIPFNSRQFIKNQRFSVSGMPIWYGGASLAGSYFEMRKPELIEYSDLKISAWGFNPVCYSIFHGDKQVMPKTKIYDITNEIYDAINSTFYLYLNESNPELKKNYSPTIISYLKNLSKQL